MSAESPSSDDSVLEDALIDVDRMEEMIDSTNSVAARHLMLEELLGGIKVIFKRFSKSLRPESPSVIKLSDMTAAFRLLQLVENVLVTTENETPWIDEILWDKFCKLEEKALHGIRLTHVAILVMRQVNLAKPLVKVSNYS